MKQMVYMVCTCIYVYIYIYIWYVNIRILKTMVSVCSPQPPAP